MRRLAAIVGVATALAACADGGRALGDADVRLAAGVDVPQTLTAQPLWTMGDEPAVPDRDALAATLALPATFVEDPDGWTTSAGSRRLRLFRSAGVPWVYDARVERPGDQACVTTPAATPEALGIADVARPYEDVRGPSPQGVSCLPPVSGPVEGAVAGPEVSDQAALAAAAAILRTNTHGPATARRDGTLGVLAVAAPLLVGGLEARDMDAHVWVGPGGTVLRAGGFLARAAPAGSVPAVAVADALDGYERALSSARLGYRCADGGDCAAPPPALVRLEDVSQVLALRHAVDATGRSVPLVPVYATRIRTGESLDALADPVAGPDLDAVAVARVRTGTLHVEQRVAGELSAGVSRVRVETPDGRLVTHREHLAAHEPDALVAKLPTGTYRVRSYQVPCADGCRSFGPPSASCETTVTLAPGAATRLVVRVAGRTCTVRRRG